MIKTIGIIGAGMIGGNVARLSVAAGFKVIICNSRNPDTLSGLIRELGSNARAAIISETITQSDLVVAAIPLFAYQQLPVEELKGKIVIDTMNYYPARDGRMTEFEHGKMSSSETVQHFLKGAIVVKTLNSMDFETLLSLAQPSGSAQRSAVPIACDNKEVAESVANFLDNIGYDAVYMGDLAQSWRSEPTMPAYVMPYHRYHVTTEYLQELLAAAVRHNAMFG